MSTTNIFIKGISKIKEEFCRTWHNYNKDVKNLNEREETGKWNVETLTHNCMHDQHTSNKLYFKNFIKK